MTKQVLCAGDSKRVAKTGGKVKPKAKPKMVTMEKAANIDASIGDASEIITVTPFTSKQFHPEKWRAAKRAIQFDLHSVQQLLEFCCYGVCVCSEFYSPNNFGSARPYLRVQSFCNA